MSETILINEIKLNEIKLNDFKCSHCDLVCGDIFFCLYQCSKCKSHICDDCSKWIFDDKLVKIKERLCLECSNPVCVICGEDETWDPIVITQYKCSSCDKKNICNNCLKYTNEDNRRQLCMNCYQEYRLEKTKQ